MAAGIVLDKRLQAVADLVREGSVVADIGTDHGYLVCHLVASRKCPRAFACDIAQGPLNRARQTILREGLDARILTMRCNGLQGIPADAVDDIVIAGMGGDMIAQIILAWEGSRIAEKRFVLQPMSKPEHLRRVLYREGFMLSKEIAVLCGRHVYIVMVAQHIGAGVEISRLFAHTGTLLEREELGEAELAYLRAVQSLCRKKADGYAKSKDQAHKALEYAMLVQRIEKQCAKG